MRPVINNSEGLPSIYISTGKDEFLSKNSCIIYFGINWIDWVSIEELIWEEIFKFRVIFGKHFIYIYSYFYSLGVVVVTNKLKQNNKMKIYSVNSKPKTNSIERNENKENLCQNLLDRQLSTDCSLQCTSLLLFKLLVNI